MDTVSALFRHEDGEISQLTGSWVCGQQRAEASFYDTARTHVHSFLDAITEGRPTEVTAHDGVRGLEIIEVIIASAERS